MSFLIPYKPPEWTKCLTYIPAYRLELINTNTPIQRWDVPGTPEGFHISIKRDDMTESTMSGNKSRKLEFLLAEAIRSGCNHVITCGTGYQSNHCRAMTVGARRFQLKPHICLAFSDEMDTSDVGCAGNMLLNRLAGADMHIMKSEGGILSVSMMDDLAQSIKHQTGEESYIIPLGGTNKVGVFGYISAFEEMMLQGILEAFDDVVVPLASTGTAAGLGIANYLTGSKIRLHGVQVADRKEAQIQQIEDIMKDVGLTELHVTDIIDIIEGYVGRGYALSTQEELESILEVSQKTGIMLDPVYTGKTAIGMIKELHSNPQRFKGNRILFIHTGGIFTLFDGRIDSLLHKSLN